MKHLILGTAGHIDHGKTSLVKALTGTDTDRLPEEKARGITIELGFASLGLPDGTTLGIVDVPGHERFVRTMVAGVGGIDFVVLIIAADEGIMPQTREHLDICRLLGVKDGVVALTKTDMVDDEWLSLVTEEVREYLAGSFLAGAGIVPVSSRTGRGLKELERELVRLAGRVAQKSADGPFRLPIDRVFSAAGFGTVVTGTLLSGSVSVGDEIEILPSGRESRVRGIQIHGKRVETAKASQRLAVNLQGVEHAEVRRGEVVTPRSTYRATRTIDVRLDHLASSARQLRHRAMLRLHSATYEVPAQVILLDRDRLDPGETAFVQLRLQYPVLLLPGDPFVLRTHSPAATIAGGRVIDPGSPRRRRRTDAALRLLSVLAEGTDADKLRLLVSESLFTGISCSELATRSGLAGKRLEATLAALLSGGDIVQVVREPRIFISREAFSDLACLLKMATEAYLKENSLKAGIGKEELKTRLPRRSDPRFFGPLLASLEKEKAVLVDRELVKLPGRAGKAAGTEEGVRKQIAGLLGAGGIEPPTVKEVGEAVKRGEKEVLEHLNLLVRAGRSVKVKSDLFYAPAPLAEIREKLLQHLESAGEITPSGFRELTGLSRKFMIPLLEYFDQEKLTIRVGEKRVLRKKG